MARVCGAIDTDDVKIGRLRIQAGQVDEDIRGDQFTVALNCRLVDRAGASGNAGASRGRQADTKTAEGRDRSGRRIFRDFLKTVL